MSIINNTLVAYDISYQEIDLIVTSLMAFFTLLIVIFNLKYLKFISGTNPTYIRAKELHSENIKTILKELKSRIDSQDLTFNLVSIRPTNCNSDIKNNHPNFFNDLKEHEPTDLKISQDWNKYNQYIDDNESFKFEFFNKIVYKITSETGLKYTLNLESGEDVFGEILVNKIYKVMRDNYLDNAIILPININILKKSLGGKTIYEYGSFAKSNDKDKLDRLEQIGLNLQNVVESEGWLMDFEKLDNSKAEFKEIKSKLLRKIDEFLLLPLYPEDCNIIKIIKKNL